MSDPAENDKTPILIYDANAANADQDGWYYSRAWDWLARRKEVTAGAKLVYYRLARYEGDTGLRKAFPRLSVLADAVGVSRITAFRHVHELVRHGLLKIEPGVGHSSTYEFLAHPWMDGEHRQSDNAPASGESVIKMITERYQDDNASVITMTTERYQNDNHMKLRRETQISNSGGKAKPPAKDQPKKNGSGGLEVVGGGRVGCPVRARSASLEDNKGAVFSGVEHDKDAAPVTAEEVCRMVITVEGYRPKDFELVEARQLLQDVPGCDRKSIQNYVEALATEWSQSNGGVPPVKIRQLLDARPKVRPPERTVRRKTEAPAKPYVPTLEEVFRGDMASLGFESLRTRFQRAADHHPKESVDAFLRAKLGDKLDAMVAGYEAEKARRAKLVADAMARPRPPKGY